MLSGMHLGGRKRVPYKAILNPSFVSAFYGKICGIAENFPKFLKSVVHIPEERHLGLSSLCIIGVRVG